MDRCRRLAARLTDEQNTTEAESVQEALAPSASGEGRDRRFFSLPGRRFWPVRLHSASRQTTLAATFSPRCYSRLHGVARLAVKYPIVLLLCMLGLSVVANAREWLYKGEVVRGEAVRLTDEQFVTIELDSGTRLFVDLKDLSPADRTYVLKHREALSRGERPPSEAAVQPAPPVRPPRVEPPAVPDPGDGGQPARPWMPEEVAADDDTADAEAETAGSANSVDDLYRRLLDEVETLFPETDYGTVKVIAVCSVFAVLFGALLVWALATEIVIALFKEATNGFAWSLLMGFLVMVVTWLTSVASGSIYTAEAATQRWLSLGMVLLLTWLVLALMAKIDVLKALPMAIFQFLIFCLGAVCLVLLLFGILLITVDLVGHKAALLPLLIGRVGYSSTTVGRASS